MSLAASGAEPPVADAPADAPPDPADAPPRVSSRSNRLVVLYDRDCGLCAATARRLGRWDRHGRLDVVTLQSAATSGRPRLVDAARERPLLEALHVVDEASGRVLAGGDAALAIAAALPGGRVVRPLAAIPPLRWSVGLGYGLVARNRHRIGRWLRLEGPACDVDP